MNRLICIVCFLMVSLVSMAQDYAVSTSQTGGRYEIIQSATLRRYTFKLDKYTGEVYQMTRNKEDRVVWEGIMNIGLSDKYPDHRSNQEITYQLFFSSISPQDCFLLNIKTGVTWQLAYDTEMKVNFFYLID